MARLFPIADLRTLAARALQDGNYTPAASGRVRAVPDTRTIRYYATLGLIDRPAEMKGRTALYGNRHVLQIVAIKRLQAQDMTLSDIQQALLGADIRKLRKFASLPTGFWNAADEYLQNSTRRDSEQKEEKAKQTPTAKRRADFWAVPPSDTQLNSDVASDQSSVSLKQAALSKPTVSQQINIPIYPGVSLTIDLSRQAEQTLVANDIQMDAIQNAAEDLVAELIRQRLLKQPRLPNSSSQTNSEESR